MPDSGDDLIVGYQILATLDFGTREICRALDGRQFPNDQGRRAPFYRRCRCISLPVTRALDDLGWLLPCGQVRVQASQGKYLCLLLLRKAVAATLRPRL